MQLNYHLEEIPPHSHTHQGNNQCEEPGIDEEIVSPYFNNVKQKGCHWQQNTLSHDKLLDSILKKKSQCL